MRPSAVLLLACLSLTVAPRCHAAPAPPAAPAPAAKEAFSGVFDPDLIKAFPEVLTTVRLVNSSETELSDYLGNPGEPCTLFATTAQALQTSLKWLGKYAGKAAQNRTLAADTLNYHVVPGRALTVKQLGTPGGVSKVLTRANQTLYFHTPKGSSKPTVYARPDMPAHLNKTDIRVGSCIMHTMDTALIPPTSSDMVHVWLEAIGAMPATPKAQQPPKKTPLPESIEAGGRSAIRSAVAAAPGGAGPAAQASSAGVRTGGWGTLTAALVCVAALLRL